VLKTLPYHASGYGKPRTERCAGASGLAIALAGAMGAIEAHPEVYSI
jgi:hypothetical protein